MSLYGVGYCVKYFFSERIAFFNPCYHFVFGHAYTWFSIDTPKGLYMLIELFQPRVILE